MIFSCLGDTLFKSTQCSYATLRNIRKGIKLVEYQQRSRLQDFLWLLLCTQSSSMLISKTMVKYLSQTQFKTMAMCCFGLGANLFMIQKRRLPLGDYTHISKNRKSFCKYDATVCIPGGLEAFPHYALMAFVLLLTVSVGFYNLNAETPLGK